MNFQRVRVQRRKKRERIVRTLRIGRAAGPLTMMPTTFNTTRARFVAAALMLLAAPRAKAEALAHDGVERSYEVHVPAAVRAAKKPAPLLVVLHGRGGGAKQIRAHAAFDVEADRLGFVVAYPDGIDRRWADARQLTLAKEKQVGTDDVGFLLAVVETLAVQGLVDKERVYFAGHSNGGFMSLTMACLHADKIRGVAAVAGGLPRIMPGIGGSECTPARAVTTMIIHATADPLVPFEGGSVGRKGERGFIRSNDEAVAVFANAASCGPAVKRAPVDVKPKDGTTLVVEERGGCTVPVVRAILVDGGHGWPGHPPRMMKASDELDATRAIADLFFAGKGP